MNNELIAKLNGSNITPIPEGVFVGVCYSVVDIGQQYSEKFDKATHKIVVSWEVPEHRIDVERDGKKVNLPRTISKRFSLSLGDKAILRRDLEAWRGRAFTAAELKGFNLKNLLGAACQLQIIHTQKDSKAYANVGTIMALPKGVKGPKPENAPVFFTLANLDSNQALPATLPEWIQNLIKQSSEWQKVMSKTQKAEGQAQAAPTPATTTEGQSTAAEDDVAF